MERIKAFLEISRWRIQLVSLATILIGPLYAADNISNLVNLDLLLFGILFLSTITFACNINCFFDRDVDILKKKNLARSVDILGASNVRTLMIFETFVIFLLIVYFFLQGYPIIALLASIGWFFGFGYSAYPIRLKGRGLLGPISVNLGVYVLPILAGYLVIDNNISTGFLIFIAGYSLLNLGINLVNVAEDYEVDKNSNIITIAHKLGVGKTIGTASLTAWVGGAVILVTLFPLINDFYTGAIFIIMLIAILFTSIDITLILISENIHQNVQKKGKRLPIYFISTRYPMVLMLLFSLL